MILHPSRSNHNHQFNKSKQSYNFQASYTLDAAISTKIKDSLETAMKNTEKVGLFINKLALLENKHSKNL